MPTKQINEKYYQLLQKPFQISSVCREDIMLLGKQKNKSYSVDFIKSIDDGQMEGIADRMSDVFLDNLYWEALEMLCDDLLREWKRKP